MDLSPRADIIKAPLKFTALLRRWLRAEEEVSRWPSASGAAAAADAAEALDAYVESRRAPE